MEVVPLRSLVTTITKGTTPTTLGFAFSDTGVPFLRAEDVDGGSVRVDSVKRYISTECHQSLRRSQIEAGDVLVTIAGTIGRVATVPSNVVVANCNQAVAIIRPLADRLQQDYLLYALRSPGVQGQLTNQGTTATITNVSLAQIGDLKVPYCSQERQLRIIDILSRAENIVRMRREAEQRAKEIIPALFLDMFGDPATNPKGWGIQTLASLVTFVSGGTPSKFRDDYWQGTLPWVSPKDMKVAEIRDAEDHISDQVPIETSIKLIPAGAVLIVVRGMILVHTVPLAIARTPVTINQDMKALLVKTSGIGADYLMWLLRISQGWLLTLVTTAAHGTRKIDTARLEALSIPVPPRSLQDSFVQHVSSLLSVYVALGKAKNKAESAFQSLLAGVFGEVP
jgi:type I restriction enzyme, S subunit